jgi:hypothetical protein
MAGLDPATQSRAARKKGSPQRHEAKPRCMKVFVNLPALRAFVVSLLSARCARDWVAGSSPAMTTFV